MGDSNTNSENDEADESDDSSFHEPSISPSTTETQPKDISRQPNGSSSPSNTRSKNQFIPRFQVTRAGRFTKLNTYIRKTVSSTIAVELYVVVTTPEALTHSPNPRTPRLKHECLAQLK